MKKYSGVSKFFEVLNKYNLTEREFRTIYDCHITGEGRIPGDEELLQEMNALFMKPAKKKVIISIPPEKIIEFNELFPAIKIPTSKKYARCSVREVESAFIAFFKAVGDRYSWEIILQATQNYVSEYEQNNWEYMKRSKYFIRRQNNDRSNEFELEEYCERVLTGEQEETKHNFQEKIV